MAQSRWTEDKARTVLRACRQSGLSVHAFAKARGLSPERLYRWRRKLDEASVELLPVEVTSVRPSEPVLVLLRSGHTLKVGRNFDEGTFSRVVKVLESC